MKNTRILFSSDVHLCHFDWCGRSSEERMDNMIRQMNEYYDEKPYEMVVFLGDYSLDHWKWQIKGSWLEQGINNTERFIREYVSRLKVPSYLMPGNHEQYGDEMWKKMTGGPRQGYFTVGGYLVICCDNYAKELDPDYHHDGVYTVTDLDFVRKVMAQNPQLPVILCGHNFDQDKEPEEFYAFLKEEKRIVLLMCGHDHITEIHDMGEKADHVCVVYDGHYAYPGMKRSVQSTMWGFCDAVLSDEGVDIRYVEPENDIMIDGAPYHHEYREQNHRFFKRRDL